MEAFQYFNKCCGHMCADKQTSLGQICCVGWMRSSTWRTRGSCSKACGTLPHVASTTVSLKWLLLIPFYLGLHPAAGWVPLLEAYFIMHLKRALRSISCASTSHRDNKGKISCRVPVVPSLEKEEEPAWLESDRIAWMGDHRGGGKSSNKILPFQRPTNLSPWPACPRYSNSV